MNPLKILTAYLAFFDKMPPIDHTSTFMITALCLRLTPQKPVRFLQHSSPSLPGVHSKNTPRSAKTLQNSRGILLERCKCLSTFPFLDCWNHKVSHRRIKRSINISQF